jgi:multiple sugar transport system ATP-binding protein
MAKVSLRNVSNSSREQNAAGLPVIHDLNLEIGDGEFTVVTGPRGSGKRSLIRMIAGLETITRGEILIGECRVNDIPAKDRDLAMVFRGYAFYPRMSVYENMAFGLRLRKFAQAEIDKRVQDAAAILGLEQFLKAKPAVLSAEQQLRLAIGRAIVRQPKVILFDDPLANLDSATQEKMRYEIARLHQRLETTMISTTADPVEAMRLADRVVVLHDGTVEQDGAPSAIYAAPANMFVAGFLGQPGMNLINGTLKPERDGFLFRESGDGTIEVRLPVDPPVGDFAGKPIVLGVRPEDFTLVPATSPQKVAPSTFPALLDVVESVGLGTNLYLQTGVHNLVVRSPEVFDRGNAGRRIRLTIDPAKAHFFDPVSTNRIALR